MNPTQIVKDHEVLQCYSSPMPLDKTVLNRPNVYDYLDYRVFLRDMVDFLKSRKIFSTRRFAKRAGFKGNSFLSLVIKGQRNLSKKSISKVAQGLKLTPAEAAFFSHITQYGIAKSFADKEAAYSAILRSKKFQRVHAVTQAESEYFSHWYIVALFEALGTQFSEFSDEKMAERLGITHEELANAQHVLARLGLIGKDQSRWKRLHDTLQTENEVKSDALGRFHKQMILKAAQSVDSIKSAERSISALTIPLSRKAFLELKEKVIALQKEIGVLSEGDSSPDSVYQFNVQIFPIVSVK